ncbi:MAG TPA: RidA family protein [Longimicrobiales bacterium]|nr:RidA family protein [Longimicrobiales bacterium]
MTDPEPVPRAAERRLVATHAPWAARVGYSRAVRVGDVIHVSGTAAVDESGAVAYPGDPYRQARRALEIILASLREAGAGAEHVVRTRMYVADASRWEEVARAHGEVFADVRPATTLVAVAGFVDPAILVEIEAEAIV